MKELKEVFIDGEIVNVKRGMFGYRIVNPIKDRKGNYIWINFLIGGWGNFFKLLLIMFVLLSFLYGAQQMTEGCKDLAENPCAYTNLDCSLVTDDWGPVLFGGDINYGEEKG